jgi:hypothetical protein
MKAKCPKRRDSTLAHRLAQAAELPEPYLPIERRRAAVLG